MKNDDPTSNDAKQRDTDSPELKLLKEVQALKSVFSALLPTVPQELDPGTIDATDAETLAGSLLMHHAMRTAAGLVADKVKHAIPRNAPEKARVLIVTSLDQASNRYRHLLVAMRLDDLNQRAGTVLDNLDAPPDSGNEGDRTQRLDVLEAVAESFAVAPAAVAGLAPAAVAGLAAAAGGAVDLLVSATQSKLTIREKAVAIARVAMVAPVVDRLLDGGLEVSLDEAVGLRPDNPILKSLADLMECRVELVARAAWTRTALVKSEDARLIAELTEHLTVLRKKHAESEGEERAKYEEDVSATEQKRRTIQDRVDLATYKADIADGVVTAIDEYIAVITQSEAGHPAPLLTASLHAQLTEKDCLLYVDSVTGGGGSLWKASLGPDRALHQGGIAVAWVLTNFEGAAIAAGVETALSSQGTKPDASPNLGQATATSIST